MKVMEDLKESKLVVKIKTIFDMQITRTDCNFADKTSETNNKSKKNAEKWERH